MKKSVSCSQTNETYRPRAISGIRRVWEQDRVASSSENKYVEDTIETQRAVLAEWKKHSGQANTFAGINNFTTAKHWENHLSSFITNQMVRRYEWFRQLA